MKRAAVLLLSLLAGCDLYWNHNGDDTNVCPVTTGGGVSGGAPAYEVRDPATGACTYYDVGGGGGYCEEYDDNGCCTYYAPYEGVDEPYGAYCSGQCEYLDEGTCTSTPGCHAEYEEIVAYPDDGTDNNGSTTIFVSCWDIQPLTPLEGGGCEYLDSNTCAQHDDCVSVMSGQPEYDADGNYAENGSFVQCAPVGNTIPPDSCAGVDCGVGATCEQQCYPCDPSDGSTGCMSSCGPICVPDQTCDNVDCGPGYACSDYCDATGFCYPACFPNGPGDPGSCTGTVTCNEMAPSCPAGTTAGIENGCYTGFCIPNTQCGPNNPGTCDKTGVTCNSAPPSCPSGTTPGAANGCWTGFCIPDANCPPAACETLTTEMACEGRGDCTPVYNGSGCTCDADGSCTCTSESFARCETLGGTAPGGPIMN